MYLLVTQGLLLVLFLLGLWIVMSLLKKARRAIVGPSL